MTALKRRGPAGPRRDRVPPRVAVYLAVRVRGLLLRLADRLVPAPIAVLEHAHAFSVCHLLAAIAELGIADHLGEGPKTAAELATRAGADADALHRVLRAASLAGIVGLDREGRFTATRLTRPLQSGDPSAAADWCRYIGSSSLQAAWSGLAETVRSCENAFRRVHGADPFTWFSAHPDEGHLFASGLGGLTRLEAAMIYACYPFPSHGVICDIGGGAGVLLGEILARRPNLRGILLESPPVLEEAAAYLQSAGLAARVELAEGDFFHPIDVRADVYVLKWVLHDWDDGTCGRILANIAAAMPAGARLVVIEGDQPANQAHPRFSMIDVQMLTVTDGGRERSAAELERLLTQSRLSVGRVRHTPTDLVLIEATAAAAVMADNSTPASDQTTGEPEMPGHQAETVPESE